MYDDIQDKPIFSFQRVLWERWGDLKNIPPIAMETYDAMSTLLIIYGNCVLSFSDDIYLFTSVPRSSLLSNPPSHSSSFLSSPHHTPHCPSLLLSPLPFSHLSVPSSLLLFSPLHLFHDTASCHSNSSPWNKRSLVSRRATSVMEQTVVTQTYTTRDSPKE